MNKKEKEETTTRDYTNDDICLETDINIIYKRMKIYEPLIKSQSIKLMNQFNNLPLERKDIEIKLMMDAICALKKFDPEKGYTLGNYLKMVLTASGINYCRVYSSNKHIASNGAEKVFEEFSSYEEEDLLSETKEEIIDILDSRKRDFNEREFIVLKLYVETSGLKEAQKKLNISSSTSYRLLNSAIEKFQQF